MGFIIGPEKFWAFSQKLSTPKSKQALLINLKTKASDNRYFFYNLPRWLTSQKLFEELQ